MDKGKSGPRLDANPTFFSATEVLTMWSPRTSVQRHQSERGGNTGEGSSSWLWSDDLRVSVKAGVGSSKRHI